MVPDKHSVQGGRVPGREVESSPCAEEPFLGSDQCRDLATWVGRDMSVAPETNCDTAGGDFQPYATVEGVGRATGSIFVV